MFKDGQKNNTLQVCYVETDADNDEERKAFGVHIRKGLRKLKAKDFVLCVICHYDLTDRVMTTMLHTFTDACNEFNICLSAMVVDHSDERWQIKAEQTVMRQLKKRYQDKYGPLHFNHMWSDRQVTSDGKMPSSDTCLIEKCSKRTQSGRKKFGKKMLAKIIQQDLTEITLIVAFTYEAEEDEIADVFQILKGAANMRYIGLAAITIDPQKYATQDAIDELADEFRRKLADDEILTLTL